MRFLVLVLLLTARTLTAKVLPDAAVKNAAQTTKGAYYYLLADADRLSQLV
jgi:hypothetical protein